MKRVVLDEARRATTTHSYDFRTAYVDDLGEVLDMEAIHRARGGLPLIHRWCRCPLLAAIGIATAWIPPS